MPTLVSISVTPANSTLATGGTLSFSATGAFSDNTTADVTTTATWSSSVDAVATVSDAAGSKGRATGVAAGTTAIIAMIGTVSGSTNLTVTGGGAAATNVMAITVNGSLCSDATSSGYINKPCVSVTVCNPGTSVCQTIPDILLDTGSYGLRIFRSAIPGLTLPQVTTNSGSLAACVQFADDTSLWGSVQLADVQLGSEPVVQIPVQIIDASFGVRPSSCANADPDPATAGYTGILGVGVFSQDCGQACVNNAGIGIYFSCTGAACSGTTVPLANQIQNPAAHLPLDNNGILVQLPPVALGGVPSVSGSLIFGIGTQANNIPAAPTVFPIDAFGDFRTIFNGVNRRSFLDTGSNGIFFPSSDPLLPVCSAPNSEWYCPPATTAFSATTIGATGSPSAPVSFDIGNFANLISTGNQVFSEVGGPFPSDFDWGLPFFMGRNVFFGFQGKVSGLGTGPYVAY